MLKAWNRDFDPRDKDLSWDTLWFTSSWTQTITLFILSCTTLYPWHHFFFYMKQIQRLKCDTAQHAGKQQTISVRDSWSRVSGEELTGKASPYKYTLLWLNEDSEWKENKLLPACCTPAKNLLAQRLLRPHSFTVTPENGRFSWLESSTAWWDKILHLRDLVTCAGASFVGHEDKITMHYDLLMNHNA